MSCVWHCTGTRMEQAAQASKVHFCTRSWGRCVGARGWSATRSSCAMRQPRCKENLHSARKCRDRKYFRSLYTNQPHKIAHKGFSTNTQPHKNGVGTPWPDLRLLESTSPYPTMNKACLASTPTMIRVSKKRLHPRVPSIMLIRHRVESEIYTKI